MLERIEETLRNSFNFSRKPQETSNGESLKVFLLRDSQKNSLRGSQKGSLRDSQKNPLRGSQKGTLRDSQNDSKSDSTHTITLSLINSSHMPLKTSGNNSLKISGNMISISLKDSLKVSKTDNTNDQISLKDPLKISEHILERIECIKISLKDSLEDLKETVNESINLLRESIKNIKISIKEETLSEIAIDNIRVPVVSKCSSCHAGQPQPTTTVLKRKKWPRARAINLTWKNNTRIMDSILIEAMNYWELACGVKFIKDEKNPFFTFVEASELLEKHPDLQGVVAQAFLPGDPAPQTIKIFKLFDNQFNRIGALAHELGHLLGFRHEHIFDPNPKEHWDEDKEDAEHLTVYDPNSIMNYQRIWDDEKKLLVTKLSEMDISGARIIYGDPIIININTTTTNSNIIISNDKKN